MANAAADSAFVRRLAAAARAAWWTFLIGAILAPAEILAYVAVPRDSGWWVEIAHYMFIFAVMLILVAVAISAIFLSLWVRRLRRVGDA